MTEKEPGQLAFEATPTWMTWEQQPETAKVLWARTEATIRADERARVIEEAAKVAETFGEPNRFTVPDGWRQELTPSDVYEVAAVDVSLWIETAIRAMGSKKQ